MPDPFPVRSALVKKGDDEVDLDLREILSAQLTGDVLADSCRTGQHVAILRAGSGNGFASFIAMIGDHPEGDGFHHPLLRAASSYVGEHGREGTDKEELYEVLRKATLTADASRHSAEEVARRARREHIMPMIESALAKFGNDKSTRQKSRRIEGTDPHYKTVDSDLNAAMLELNAILDRVF
jgi:hypothetical protein